MRDFLEEYFIAIGGLMLLTILICLSPLLTNYISEQFNQT